MSDHSFESQLSHLAPPTIDPAARLEAKRAALAEFARVHADDSEHEHTRSSRKGLKAFFASLRLTREHSQHGRALMSVSTRNTLLGSFATLSVAALGVAVMWPTIQRDGGLVVPELPAQRNSIEQTSSTRPVSPSPSTPERIGSSQESEIVYIDPAIITTPEVMLEVPPPEIAIDLPVAPPATAITQTTAVRPAATQDEGLQDIIVTGYRGARGPS